MMEKLRDRMEQLKDQMMGQLKDQMMGQLKDQMMGQLKDQMMGQLKNKMMGQLEQQLYPSRRLDLRNYETSSIPPLVHNSGNLQ